MVKSYSIVGTTADMNFKNKNRYLYNSPASVAIAVAVAAVVSY